MIPPSIPASELETPGGFVADCQPTDLIYFVLNVGDGDTQMLLLPEDAQGTRRAVVVDVASEGKLTAFVAHLAAAIAPSGHALLPGPQPGRPSDTFKLVIGTHPHLDHIGGMRKFIDRFHEHIDEFWEPGYYHPSKSYIEMMRALEDHDIRHTQPTSGTTRWIGRVKVTVLAPGIGLRNRFDSYGIDVNDASISIKLDFPASRVIETDKEPAPAAGRMQRRKDRSYVRLPTTRTLVLGADCQTTSWSQVLVDFPQLGPEKTVVTDALRKARGYEPLNADVLKISHHGSKHGINLELVETIAPPLSFVSSVGGGGSFEFPHEVAMNLVREAREARTSTPAVPHSPDHELGIHYTGGLDDGGRALGSIALIISATGARRRLWRLMDAAANNINLADAERYKGV